MEVRPSKPDFNATDLPPSSENRPVLKPHRAGVCGAGRSRLAPRSQSGSTLRDRSNQQQGWNLQIPSAPYFARRR